MRYEPGRVYDPVQYEAERRKIRRRYLGALVIGQWLFRLAETIGGTRLQGFTVGITVAIWAIAWLWW